MFAETSVKPAVVRSVFVKGGGGGEGDGGNMYDILYLSGTHLCLCCKSILYAFDDTVRYRSNNYLCTCDLYTPVHNVLEARIYITWGSWRGLGPGIPEFFGPCEMASSR